MDRFTRNYLIVFGAVVGGLVLWWGIANWQPQVWRLNGLLDDEPTLAAFRTAEMPAARFLGILRPELAGRREDDAALIAAERQLAAVQGRARELLLAQPDVREVRWVLDRDWYLQRGVKP